jgi:penicillin-binding protein 1A
LDGGCDDSKSKIQNPKSKIGSPTYNNPHTVIFPSTFSFPWVEDHMPPEPPNNQSPDPNQQPSPKQQPDLNLPDAPDAPDPNAPKTILGAITQAVKTVQAKVNFSQLAVKPNARVPELWVQEPGQKKAKIFPLLGEHYILGRSSKASDIVVRSPVVSQKHLSLTRDSTQANSPFILRDENSTNGIYRGKRRLNKLTMRHGDILTLGPPELEAAVRVQYHYPPPWYATAFRYGLYGFTGLTGIVAAWVAFEWQKFSVYPLPAATDGPVVVYANDGITPLRDVDTRPHAELKSLRDFSPHLPNAVIASEDERYNWHLGVDPLGIARAVFTNLSSDRIREGASTITQQLARSTFREYVGTEDSADRKLREAVVALKLETFYSKDDLMRTYLNRVFLGNGLYGFEDASQFYFGKSAKDLDVSEAATLVGMLPAPNRLNPVSNYKLSLEYRDRVIQRMAEQGRISAEQANKARRSRVNVSPDAIREIQSTIAPYFYDHVFIELEEILGPRLAKEGNFIIESSLDAKFQAQAEAVYRSEISNSGAAKGYSQGGLVTMDTSNGKILAMIGGMDYQTNQFNRATQAERQPGSTFKIFAYLTALEQGISPNTVFSCAPLPWGGIVYDGCGGDTNMYGAIPASLNAIALRVGREVGLENVAQTARALGLKSKLDPVPGMILGQSSATVMEMTAAFGTIANDGKYNTPRTISRILDGGDCKNRKDYTTCRVMYDVITDPLTNRQVLRPETARTMATIMRGVITSGTGRAAAVGLDEGGKTGTTNDAVDLWFIGFIPSRQLVTGIWLGNDDNQKTSGTSGDAAALWGEYMKRMVR